MHIKNSIWTLGLQKNIFIFSNTDITWRGHVNRHIFIPIPTTHIKTLAGFESEESRINMHFVAFIVFQKNRLSILTLYNPTVVHQLCWTCLSTIFTVPSITIIQSIILSNLSSVSGTLRLFSSETAERNWKFRITMITILHLFNQIYF